MNARPFIPPLASEAAPIVRTAARWSGGGETPPLSHGSGRGTGFGVFCLVGFGHILPFALAMTQVMTISAPEQASSGGSGPLRVRLVSDRPVPAAPPPVVPPVVVPPVVKPVLPKAEKKTLATEAPSQRVVEAPAPKPELVSAPVPQEVAVPEATPTTQALVTQPLVQEKGEGGSQAGAGNPDVLDLGSAPKEVGQIVCRVPKPEYPRSARRRGEVGTVSIRMVMDAGGQISKAEVERSSGFPDLDAAARRAALAAHCQPYRENGRAISVTALQPFQFLPSD